MIAGIDIGGTAIKGVLTDRKGELVGSGTIATPETGSDIERAILSLIENIATSASVSKMDIEGIGIGSAGSIDKKKGAIITSPNIPGLRNRPLGRNLEKKTGHRVFLENDATVALVGAWWKGNGSRFKNWIMITLGTGIGGGVVIDNKIYTGQTGNAMEIGHMTIDYNGRECSCGNRGCLERYASATALVELARALLAEYPGSSLHARMKEEELSAKTVHEEALKKDEAAVRAMNETAQYLGYGVASLVNIFNPEAIIFGGGLSLAHRMIIPVIEKTVEQRCLPGLRENVRYMPVKDYALIPALGAARIAIDSISNGR